MKYIYVLSLLCFITAADAAVVERPATRARVVGLPTGTGLGVTNLGAGGSATNLTALNQNVGANSNFVTNSSVEKFTTNTTTGKEKEDATTEIAVKEVAKELLNILNEKKSDQTCSLPQIKNADGKCVDAQILNQDDLMYGVNARSKENANVATDYCWGKSYKDEYVLCVFGTKVSVVSANVVNAETTKIDNTFNQKDELETALSTPMAKLDDALMVATTKSDTSSKSEDSSAGAGTESADTSSKSSNSGSDTNSSAQDKAIETFSSMTGNTVAKGFDTSLFGTNTTNTTSGSNTTAPTVSSTTAKTVGGVGSVTNSTSGSNTTAPTVSSTTTKTGGGGVGSVANSTVGKVQSIFGGSVGGLFKW